MPTPPNLPTNHADGVGEVITAALVNDLATAANDIATNGAIPKGTAGGALQGTYPNPTLKSGAATGAVLGADVITTGTAQIKTGIFTAPFRDKGGQTINVKAWGAIGDGASHPISAADISANTQWIGSYVAGDEWDYVAIQEGIYAAFANTSTPGNVVWNGTANKQLNRPLYFPAGLYLINNTLTIRYLVGGLIYGDGRLASRLTRTSPSGTTHLLSFNGCSHSTFRDFGLLSNGGSHGTNGSLMNIDFDNTAGGAGLHGCLLANMAFDCQTNAASIDYGCRVAFTQWQGDTFSFHSCLFQGAQKAAAYFGGFNALSQNFVNCDFIQQIVDDIYVTSGSVSTYGCQVEGTAWGSSAKSGYFVNIPSGAGNHSQIISHTRCEVPRLASLAGNGVGMVVLEANSVAVGASRNDWTPNQVYSLNDTVRANGSIYVCTVAGTSQNPGPPAWAVGGATITDNTVTWVHQDFAVVFMSAHGVFIGNLLPWGQIKGPTYNTQISFIGNTFSRSDWLAEAGNPYDNSLTSTCFVKAFNNRVVYTGNLSGAVQQYSSPGHGANVDDIPAYAPMWMGTEPIIWQTGAGSNNASADVGLGRNDGTSLPNNVGGYAETRKSRNVLALVGPDASLGRLVPTAADTAGDDLRLQGGLGTGTGVGGGVSLRAAPTGSTGTTPNNASEVFRVDPTGIYFKDVAIFNGQSLGFKVLTELTTIAAAATTSTTIQIPAGAVVHAVSVRVTTTIPTAASMMIGDGTTAAKFNTGASIAVSAGTTDVGTKAGPTYYAAATNIVITPNATPGNTNGRVRVTIHYYQVAPPTS